MPSFGPITLNSIDVESTYPPILIAAYGLPVIVLLTIVVPPTGAPGAPRTSMPEAPCETPMPELSIVLPTTLTPLTRMLIP
jgi:hypothetical protein